KPTTSSVTPLKSARCAKRSVSPGDNPWSEVWSKGRLPPAPEGRMGLCCLSKNQVILAYAPPWDTVSPKTAPKAAQKCATNHGGQSRCTRTRLCDFLGQCCLATTWRVAAHPLTWRGVLVCAVVVDGVQGHADHLVPAVQLLPNPETAEHTHFD